MKEEQHNADEPSVASVLSSIRQAVESEDSVMQDQSPSLEGSSENGSGHKKDFLSTLERRRHDAQEEPSSSEEDVLELTHLVDEKDYSTLVKPGNILQGTSHDLAENAGSLQGALHSGGGEILAHLSRDISQDIDWGKTLVSQWGGALSSTPEGSLLFQGTEGQRAPSVAQVSSFLSQTPSVEMAGLKDESLLSAGAAASVAASLGALKKSKKAPEGQAASGDSEDAISRALGALVKEMLQPLLKAWLDKNLPAIVQHLVAEELKRLH